MGMGHNTGCYEDSNDSTGYQGGIPLADHDKKRQDVVKRETLTTRQGRPVTDNQNINNWESWAGNPGELSFSRENVSL